jgi:diaminopimelate decarboxylase
LQNNIPLSGVHIHLGSNIQQPKLYFICAQKIVSFLSQFSIKTISYIDFGGGYPSHGNLPDSSIQSNQDISTYIPSITKPFANLFPNKKPKLILEPGRFLVDDSTILISKVVNIKTAKNQQYIILDSTINMLPSAWYRKLIIKTYTPKLLPNNSPTLNTIVYGSTCQETDYLYRGLLPKISQNDIIIFFCVGAYNQSQTSNFIFKQPETVYL